MAEAQVPANQIETLNFFPTQLFTQVNADFLPAVKEVAEEFLLRRATQEPATKDHHLVHTEQISGDPRIADFVKYVAQTGWNILNAQGYAMDNYNTFLTEMWVQEHRKYAIMEQHVHPYGNQIVGMYMLDTYPESNRLTIHDPRPGKVISGLPDRDMKQVTMASNMINFELKPGQFIFAPAYLPHSFSLNMADKPMRFVHFNISTMFVPPQQPVQQLAQDAVKPQQPTTGLFTQVAQPKPVEII